MQSGDIRRRRQLEIRPITAELPTRDNEDCDNDTFYAHMRRAATARDSTNQSSPPGMQRAVQKGRRIVVNAVWSATKTHPYRLVVEIRMPFREVQSGDFRRWRHLSPCQSTNRSRPPDTQPAVVGSRRVSATMHKCATCGRTFARRDHPYRNCILLIYSNKKKPDSLRHVQHQKWLVYRKRAHRRNAYTRAAIRRLTHAISLFNR